VGRAYFGILGVDIGWAKLNSNQKAEKNGNSSTWN